MGGIIASDRTNNLFWRNTLKQRFADGEDQTFGNEIKIWRIMAARFMERLLLEIQRVGNLRYLSSHLISPPP